MQILRSALFIFLLAGCASRNPVPMGPGQDLAAAETVKAAGQIPSPIQLAPELPKPRPARKQESYSVVVSNVAVQDLLFALARDAKINADIHPGVSGMVTLNALNQTLPQIMERLAAQVPMRWSVEQGVLHVKPDEPYVQTYKIDYLNIARTVKSNVSISNSVSSTGGSVASDSGSQATASCGTAGSNSSCTMLDYSSENQFWVRLEKNLKEILGVDPIAISTGKIGDVSSLDKVANRQDKATVVTADSEREVAGKNRQQTSVEKVQDQSQQTLAALFRLQTEELERMAEFQLKQARIQREEYKRSNQVVINPETGLVLVRASHKDQQKVAEFLAQMQSSAQRQVLIEATIVEVTLGDKYQAGVDWAKLASGGSGWSFGQKMLGQNMSSAPYGGIFFSSNNFDLTVKLLEQFGRTRVLSSPKIIALNNQTAVMKVVEEQVYFTIKATPGQSDNGVISQPTYESELHTVPIGLVMQVTPQIADSGAISLNVRPTITNVSSYVADPAVAILAANSGSTVQSLIPVTQVREFDSTLKVPSGQTAVLGGLIQDAIKTDRQGIPVLSRIPTVGDLFSYRDDKASKSELIIFLRPVLVRDASMNGDFANLKGYLPGSDFFQSPQDFDLSAYQAGAVPPEAAR
ncbi:type II secretion system protein GspD [Chitinilyticum aquatile]|uniref:type II secretion system protein GspD n=1 Tax=Chitinilyticum aquatile TaxID=362520 RepID=UPI00138AFE39|nr:secretin N-terminal domain-containing protein [Chitinilyticum aquatile]